LTNRDERKSWLETYLKPEDKCKNIKLNPKYLFSDHIMNKIIKLRDIFLEFDEDGSRKLEISEIVTMLNTNNIPLLTEELLSLFYENKQISKSEEPFLDFYQFMQFALQRESD
jgi:Ca2+-binding EF-hand superfamily protein